MRALSIETKLRLIIMAASGAALLLLTLAVIGYEFVTARETIREELQTQAQIVADASANAIIFGDNNREQEILARLSHDRRIRAAAIYSGTNLVAWYPPGLPPASLGLGQAPEGSEYRFEKGRLEVWGPVEQAGVAMAGETATNVPIQLIASGSAPSSVSCSSSGNNLNTSTTLQANGILGVGPAVQDCGLLCTTSPVLPYYWLCASSSSCSSPANVPTATQVSNPVAFFGSDNNGVALAMNSVAATGAATTTAAAMATGTLYFGVGTQTDNALGSGVKAYALSSNVFGGQAYTSIKAVYNGVTYPAYVNSAESILFLLDPATVSIASCSSNIFYCPSSPVSLPLTMQDYNGNSAQINPSIGNGATLYDSSLAQGGGPNAAFSNLAGGFVPTNYDEVILGMPFFYGRTVYIGIAGQTPPTGIPTSYAGLGYWAF